MRLRASWNVINFHDRYASGVVLPAYDCRVTTGRERRDNRGLAQVGRWNASRYDLAFLCRLPIIVRGEGRATAVVEFQGGIQQRIRYAKVRQRWTDRSNEHFRQPVPGDETTDQNVVSRFDKSARADIPQLRIGRRIQIIGFHHSYTSRVVLSAQDRSVTSIVRGQRSDERRFQVVGRWDTRRFDLSLLAAAVGSGFPVVVCREGGAAAVMQLQGGVGQKVREELGQRRTDAAHNHTLRIGPRDDEPADQHIVSSLHAQARRDIEQLARGRRWRWGG